MILYINVVKDVQYVIVFKYIIIVYYEIGLGIFNFKYSM